MHNKNMKANQNPPDFKAADDKTAAHAYNKTI